MLRNEKEEIRNLARDGANDEENQDSEAIGSKKRAHDKVKWTWCMILEVTVFIVLTLVVVEALVEAVIIHEREEAIEAGNQRHNVRKSYIYLDNVERCFQEGNKVTTRGTDVQWAHLSVCQGGQLTLCCRDMTSLHCGCKDSNLSVPFHVVDSATSEAQPFMDTLN